MQAQVKGVDSDGAEDDLMRGSQGPRRLGGADAVVAQDRWVSISSEAWIRPSEDRILAKWKWHMVSSRGMGQSQLSRKKQRRQAVGAQVG